MATVTRDSVSPSTPDSRNLSACASKSAAMSFSRVPTSCASSRPSAHTRAATSSTDHVARGPDGNTAPSSGVSPRSPRADPLGAFPSTWVPSGDENPAAIVAAVFPPGVTRTLALSCMPDVPIPRRHSNASDERAMKSALEATPRTIIKDSKPTCETHVPPPESRTYFQNGNPDPIITRLESSLLIRSGPL